MLASPEGSVSGEDQVRGYRNNIQRMEALDWATLRPDRRYLNLTAKQAG